VKLVFDSHISPAVAEGLILRCRGLQAARLRDWQQRRFLNAPAPELLAAAAHDGWTLVTYDLRTIVPLLRDWAETRQHLAGVILVDDATYPGSQHWRLDFSPGPALADRRRQPVDGSSCLLETCRTLNRIEETEV